MKNWKDVEGWINTQEISILQQLAKDKICLEIGSYKGKSSVGIAEVAKEVFCVDTFSADGSGQNQHENTLTLNEFTENTKGYSNISPCVGNSKIMVPLFEDNKFDFIFIDGDHSYEGVKNDILVCWPKLKIGGIMAFHDYKWDGFNDGGPKKAIDGFFKDHKGPFFSIVYVVKDREVL